MNQSLHAPAIGQSLMRLVQSYDTNRAVRRQFWDHLVSTGTDFGQRGLYKIVLGGPLSAWVTPWAARERVICIFSYLAGVLEVLGQESPKGCSNTVCKCHRKNQQLWQSCEPLRSCFQHLQQGCLDVVQLMNVSHLAHVMAVPLEPGVNGSQRRNEWVFPVSGFGDHRPIPPLKAREQLLAVEVFTRHHAHQEYSNACEPYFLHLELTPQWKWFFPGPSISDMMLRDRRKLYHGPREDWDEDDFSAPCSMQQTWFGSPLCSSPEDVTKLKVATK